MDHRIPKRYRQLTPNSQNRLLYIQSCIYNGGDRETCINNSGRPKFSSTLANQKANNRFIELQNRKQIRLQNRPQLFFNNMS